MVGQLWMYEIPPNRRQEPVPVILVTQDLVTNLTGLRVQVLVESQPVEEAVRIGAGVEGRGVSHLREPLEDNELGGGPDTVLGGLLVEGVNYDPVDGDAVHHDAGFKDHAPHYGPEHGARAGLHQT